MTRRGRRLLLVHAHPDDETITTGATMARYAADGVQVTLLTCTLGEEGEILVPELAQLASSAADQLGGYRIGELRAAMGALGIANWHFLGGAGRFRDSGMLGTPANRHPRAFWRAAGDPALFAAAVDAAAAVIRERRPHVVVTYDPDGGYGHPDHVLAHRVTTAAVESAVGSCAGDGWRVAKVYWTATPSFELERDVAEVRAAEVPFAAEGTEQVPGIADNLVTTTIDASDFCDAKRAALQAHRTQVAVDGRFFALSNGIGRRITGVEHFRLAAGTLGPDRDVAGRERDLFSGVPA